MTSRVLYTFPLAPALLSAAVSTWSAAHNFRALTLGCLFLFCFIIILLTDGIIPHAQFKKIIRKINSSPEAINFNTLLTAYVYAWGGLCLLGVYKFSGLLWQHGVQYGIASALIAICLFLYWSMTDWTQSSLMLKRKLVFLHGFSLMIGLFYLVFSGKLSTPRGDWAANYIFLTGGITLLFLCLVTLWRDKCLISPKTMNA